MVKEYWLYVSMQGCSAMHYAGNCDADSQEEADHCAFEAACEEYDSFAGYHGIPDIEEIEEEIREQSDDGNATEEEISDAYAEAVCDHVTYWAIPARPGVDPEDEDFIYSNPWYEEGGNA